MSFSDGGFLSPEESRLSGHKRLWNEPKVRREWSDARRAEAVFRRDIKGETNIQIARAMGVSLASVSNVFQRLLESGAIQPVKDFWTPEETEQLTNLLPDKSIKQTADIMKRTYSSIRNRMLVLGIEGGSHDEQSDFNKNAIESCAKHLALLIEHHGPKAGP